MLRGVKNKTKQQDSIFWLGMFILAILIVAISFLALQEMIFKPGVSETNVVTSTVATSKTTVDDAKTFEEQLNFKSVEFQSMWNEKKIAGQLRPMFIAKMMTDSVWVKKTGNLETDIRDMYGVDNFISILVDLLDGWWSDGKLNMKKSGTIASIGNVTNYTGITAEGTAGRLLLEKDTAGWHVVGIEGPLQDAIIQQLFEDAEASNGE